MRERSFKAMRGLLAAACAMALAGTANAAVVFQEDFNSYADAAAANAVWSSGVSSLGTSYTPAMRFSSGTWSTVGTIPTITLPTQAAFFTNTFGYRTFSSTLNSDFTLSAGMISTTYSRLGRIMLMDSTGQDGYVLAWNASNTDQSATGGYFTFSRFDRTTGPITTFFDVTGATVLVANLGNGSPTYHPATGLDITLATVAKTATVVGAHDPALANVALSWVQATGVFTISVDGNVLGTQTDTTYNTFDRIYLTGQQAIFDDISVVTVPEPTAVSLLGLGGGFAALLRRKRK